MNQEQLTRIVLALFAFFIISLALSSTRLGAKFVQGLLVIAILAIVLRNNSKVIGALNDIRATLLQSPSQSSNP